VLFGKAKQIWYLKMKAYIEIMFWPWVLNFQVGLFGSLRRMMQKQSPIFIIIILS
jgi:hypothetical protein